MEHHASAIPIEILVFLGTAVLAPILFKRLGLGSIVGYLIFGILFGPAVLGVFKDPVRILHIAEFGVVLLLFLIGLEIEPSRLLAMRKEIIRLGFGQLAMTTAAIGAGAWAMGLPPITAGVVGFAFSLSSTAVAIQILNERGHLTRSYGQKTFSVLLSQDLAVVPALALVPALSVSSGITPQPGQHRLECGHRRRLHPDHRSRRPLPNRPGSPIGSALWRTGNHGRHRAPIGRRRSGRRRNRRTVDGAWRLFGGIAALGIELQARA